MKLIAKKLGQREKYDRLQCVRDDGSTTSVSMPRQGILPHDLVHALVESRLGFRDGFIGLVAKGADIDFAGQEFHRYIDPVNHAQVAQAESVVESLQAQLWSGCFDTEAFREGVVSACAMRNVPSPDMTDINPKTELFDTVIALGESWRSVPAHADWALSFPIDVAAVVP